MTTYADIPIKSLIPAHTMLRPVREDSLEFLELIDSIKIHGLMNSLLVQPHPTREGYEIIDGMWRFFACKRLDISSLPCIIKVGIKTEEEFLAIQVQANAVSYETRPMEFAEQMQKMIQLREEVGAPVTIKELSIIVGKSYGWVNSRLKLLELCDKAKKLVKDEKLPLGKAVALSRIRSHYYQEEFLKTAHGMNTREFELSVGKFIAEKREGKIAGRRELRDEMGLKPRLQSMDNLLIELDRLENVGEIIVQKNLTTALEGARITLEWVLNLHDKGRQKQVDEVRNRLSNSKRLEIIGRQRYEELKEIRELQEANQEKGDYFT